MSDEKEFWEKKLMEFEKTIIYKIEALEKKIEEHLEDDSEEIRNELARQVDLIDGLKKSLKINVKHIWKFHLRLLDEILENRKQIDELKEDNEHLKKTIFDWLLCSSKNREVLRELFDYLKKNDYMSGGYADALSDKLDSPKIHGWTKETWEEYQKRIHEGYPMVVPIKTEKKELHESCDGCEFEGRASNVIPCWECDGFDKYKIKDSGGEKTVGELVCSKCGDLFKNHNINSQGGFICKGKLPEPIEREDCIFWTNHKCSYFQNEPLNIGALNCKKCSVYKPKTEPEKDYMKEKSIFLGNYYYPCNVVDCPIKQAVLSYEGNNYCMKHFLEIIIDNTEERVRDATRKELIEEFLMDLKKYNEDYLYDTGRIMIENFEYLIKKWRGRVK